MKTILIQFDTDALPSTFDRVVAVDAGVDHLFSYGGVTPETVTGLVHGAMFTRGPADLKQTAIFVGGSQADDGDRLLKQITKTYFGPMRVSVMMDSNGCNTTAAAAVALARKHIPLTGTRAIVLGATGPVGLRAAQLLALEEADVTLVSRTLDRAESACRSLREKRPTAKVRALSASSADEYEAACAGQQIIIAAGAAGVCFLSPGALGRLSGLQLAIDLNAVPPAGIADIGAMDKAVDHGGVLVYGALGVGGLKMKIHRQAIQHLFEASDRVLDTQPLYELALRVAGLKA